jgi:hypothetical protein
MGGGSFNEYTLMMYEKMNYQSKNSPMTFLQFYDKQKYASGVRASATRKKNPAPCTVSSALVGGNQ